MDKQAHVRFINVSKRYQLGKGRTDLRAILGRLVNGDQGGDEQTMLSALQDVSFTLYPGETLGLIGANGAGKSTILKLTANITRPSTGEVELNGRVSALIELGAGFHPDLSGRDNVYLNGIILGLSRDEIKANFDEIVAFSELERFIDTPLKRYSSGMKVRLGFAVAACIRPDILLVDEVLAVGDASFRQKCLQRIQELKEGGTSIVFVSHNLYLVKAVCENALYMKDGRVVARGPTEEVIEAYERNIHEERMHQYMSVQDPEQLVSSQLEIERILVGEAGDERALHSDEAAKIRVYYQAHAPQKQANLVLRIVRADGVTCCMIRTALNGLQLTDLYGRGVVNIRMDPLQLIGGKYHVEARFVDANDAIILSGFWSDWFDVVSEELSYQERSGVFTPNVQLSHERVREEERLRDPEGTLLMGEGD